MTKTIKRNKGRIFIGTALGLIMLLGVTAFRQGQAETMTTRTIELEARDMAFYLKNKPELGNPEIKLTLGQPVKLLLHNDESGKTLHCLNILGMPVRTAADLRPGSSVTLNFTPTKKGVFPYSCNLHEGMSGLMRVE